ncbi:MORN repeat-containing protein [Mesorhizobium sp. ASY16-5R]|uniref:MORN repeat-containing protein n=1 Tax=Mesorhizobium sp. ASY16-5R TaxID=3445772 RepID=UPI003FA08867
MKAWSFGGSAALLGMLVTVAQAGDYLRPSPSAGWSERVQIVYQAATRSVERRKVRVWNPNPEKNLDFVWEPAPGQPGDGIAADGTVSGKGRLVWRVRGSASYDPKSVFSTYAGDLKDGRPDGEGRLEIRSGEVVDGHWTRGEADGQAVWIDEAGNRYEGAFSHGRPNGQGRYLGVNGEIFTGVFADGERHGDGETRLAGGTTYRSTWDHGREVGGNRPDALADAMVGGLLKAQAGGGDAGKVEIGVSIEERMNQQAQMRYQHLVRDDDIAIYPLSDDLNKLWNGGQIYSGSWMLDGVNWDESPAFVEVGVGTTDGSRVKLGKLELRVGGGDIYRKPMLTLQESIGCVGFRPTFALVNHGWGGVRDAKITLQFTGEAEDSPMSRPFEMPVDNFEDGADISIRGLLDQAGVDTAKLEQNRYSCQSRESLNVCRSQVFNDVGFGEIADFVGGEDKLFTTVAGKLDYKWTDDYGNVYPQSETFRASISLAVIEAPQELAECGDGFDGSPEAMRYQDIELPTGKRDYVVAMPVRGNKNISSYKARLKLHSRESSFHQMRVAATFADGSTRESKTISLFYFNPRPVTFESKSRPAACYLKELVGGC